MLTFAFKPVILFDRMEEKAYFLSLSYFGFLPRAFLRLLEIFKTPDEIWNSSFESFAKESGLTPEKVKKFFLFKEKFNAQDSWNKFKRSGIGLITIRDLEYPELLKEISDPPPVLFYQGNLNSLKRPCFAVIGSRKASPYGKLQASKLSETLAALGLTVVSGLARGIDQAVHEGSLKSGETTAVLGSGVDRIYPPENENLAVRIKKQGVILSEFPPGTPPDPWHFPQRNRIISGLSIGVLVVEAEEKSGALITARFALEQGRGVFALPGIPGNPLSKGTNGLIQAGGKLVQEIKDILEEFPSEVSSLLNLEAVEKSLKEGEKLPEENVAREILRLLSPKEGVCIEDLVCRMSLPVSKLSSALVFLEMKGYVSRLPGNFYVKL